MIQKIKHLPQDSVFEATLSNGSTLRFTSEWVTGNSRLIRFSTQKDMNLATQKIEEYVHSNYKEIIT